MLDLAKKLDEDRRDAGRRARGVVRDAATSSRSRADRSSRGRARRRALLRRADSDETLEDLLVEEPRSRSRAEEPALEELLLEEPAQPAAATRGRQCCWWTTSPRCAASWASGSRAAGFGVVLGGGDLVRSARRRWSGSRRASSVLPDGRRRRAALGGGGLVPRRPRRRALRHRARAAAAGAADGRDDRREAAQQAPSARAPRCSRSSPACRSSTRCSTRPTCARSATSWPGPAAAARRPARRAALSGRERIVPQLVRCRRATSGAAREAPSLRAAVAELRDHPDPDMVAFLLLRTARAFFPRVVLFLVRDERLRGLAGMGPVANGTSLDLARARAHGAARPRFAVLPRPWRSASAWSGPLPADGPLRRARRAAGRPRHGRGGGAAGACAARDDRGRLRRRAGRRRAARAGPLVDFTDQAGRALDSALLERRAPTELAC